MAAIETSSLLHDSMTNQNNDGSLDKQKINELLNKKFFATNNDEPSWIDFCWFDLLRNENLEGYSNLKNYLTRMETLCKPIS